jgi:hypothetical protein
MTELGFVRKVRPKWFHKIDSRVVIISGVPNHLAEYNQTRVNPNTRCELTISTSKFPTFKISMKLQNVDIYYLAYLTVHLRC